MPETLMKFEGDEQIQLFLKTYSNNKELEDAFNLFHVPKKNVQKVIIVRQKNSDGYVIQFHTRHGILCLKDSAIM